MESIQIDWFAVVVAAVLNMVIGFFWYSRWLFGKAWHNLSKVSEASLKGDKKAVPFGCVVSLVIAFFLAFFEAHLDVTTVVDGLFLGFCVWLGFVATTQISAVVWCKAPFKLFLIDTGCKLLSFLVMGGVLAA
jgi:hypothetical protein